jgi:hypothetical protein
MTNEDSSLHKQIKNSSVPKCMIVGNMDYYNQCDDVWKAVIKDAQIKPQNSSGQNA